MINYNYFSKMNGGIMKEKVLELINEISHELNELSLEIYNNPELGNEEFTACNLHTELLKK